MYIYVYLFTCLSLCKYIYVFIHMFVCVYIHTYLICMPHVYALDVRLICTPHCMPFMYAYMYALYMHMDSPSCATGAGTLTAG
jgi:hypothetical protein